MIWSGAYRAAVLAAVSLMLRSGVTAQEAAAGKGPGIDSPIRKIFLVAHPHLDVGFTEPPSEVADLCKSQIDRIIGSLKAHPGFVYNIESTWQLDQWMRQSTPEEIEELAGLVRARRLGVGAGYATLHSAKAGLEEVTRLLRLAQDCRTNYGMEIRTLY